MRNFAGTRVRNSQTLTEEIVGLELTGGTSSGARAASLCVIPKGSELMLIGDGHNDRTIKIAAVDRSFLVFKQDLEKQGLLQ